MRHEGVIYRRSLLKTVGVGVVAGGALSSVGAVRAAQSDPFVLDWTREIRPPDRNTGSAYGVTYDADTQRSAVVGWTQERDENRPNGLIAVLTPRGEVRARRTIDDAQLFSAVPTPGGDGAFIAAGRSYSEDSMGLSLVGFDDDGSIRWNRTHGTYRDVRRVSVEPAPNGGVFVVTGLRQSEEGERTGTVLRFSSGGEFEAEQTFADLSQVSKIRREADGTYVLIGYRSDGGENSTPVVVKLDERGDTQWSHSLSGSHDVYDIALTESDQHRYLASSASGDPESYGGTPVLTAITGAGRRAWQQSYDPAVAGRPSSEAVPTSIVRLDSDRYVVCCSLLGLPVRPWLLEIDAQGEVSWSNVYPNDQSRGINDALRDSGGDVLVAGFKSVFSNADNNYDSDETGGAWAAKFSTESSEERRLDALEPAIERKRGVAREIDSAAIHFSEADDVERMLATFREEVRAGTFTDVDVPKEAIRRHELGERVTLRLLEKTGEAETINGEQIAVRTTSFGIQLGVSLLMMTMSIKRLLDDSAYSNLGPADRLVIDDIDEVLGELVSVVFSAARQSGVLAEIRETAQQVYSGLAEGRFDGPDEFTDALSDSVAATVSNLSLQQTIETGDGASLLGTGDPTYGLSTGLLDELTNAERTLSHLDAELSPETVQSQGLAGTLAGARTATTQARRQVDRIAATTDTFLTELENRLDFLGIATNVYDLFSAAEDGAPLWRVVGTLSTLLAKAGLAVATVRLIGTFVGELSIRLMMTANARGVVGVTRGDPVGLDDIAAAVPDVDRITDRLDAAERRWGGVV